MKLITFFYRFLIRTQQKIQQLSLFVSLVIAEFFIMFGDFSLLIAIPEIGSTILMLLIIIYCWRKIKVIKKNRMFIGMINSLILWNYTFIWVYPYPYKET